jgi:hypothetical protein
MFSYLEQPPMAELPGATEERNAYLAEAVKVWRDRQKLLAALSSEDAPATRYTLDELTRNCTDAAKSLHAISPASCTDWSQGIIQFTSRAVKVLCYSEKTALRTILNLLLAAMHTCALMDLSRPQLAKGTKKAESIAVSSFLAMRLCRQLTCRTFYLQNSWSIHTIIQGTVCTRCQVPRYLNELT